MPPLLPSQWRRYTTLFKESSIHNFRLYLQVVTIKAVLRAVLYIRVSTDEQAKSGYSIAEQIRELRRYAADHGYEIVEEIIDDGYSGASMVRPGLMRVYELASFWCEIGRGRLGAASLLLRVDRSPVLPLTA